MKSKTAVLCLPLAALLCLDGCTMAPRYVRPEAPTATVWPSGAAYQERGENQTVKEVADIPWQEFFADQQLQ